MYKNAKLMLYVYGCLVVLFLLSLVCDFRTVGLIFSLCINAVTGKYIVIRNFNVC
ncbi:unknown [Firmicutes bacterium CAG:884]|nr:unknown [Firmicutes bacterium CAG:884]